MSSTTDLSDIEKLESNNDVALELEDETAVEAVDEAVNLTADDVADARADDKVVENDKDIVKVVSIKLPF
ncbi:MAG: hypothetical protein LBH87_01605, partial [Coriobacteriales bacterium]|nr:hypothetical protein [Coriobacteriales bacterium]